MNVKLADKNRTIWYPRRFKISTKTSFRDFCFIPFLAGHNQARSKWSHIVQFAQLTQGTSGRPSSPPINYILWYIFIQHSFSVCPITPGHILGVIHEEVAHDQEPGQHHDPCTHAACLKQRFASNRKKEFLDQFIKILFTKPKMTDF